MADNKIRIALQLDDKLVDGAVVKPLSFVNFSDCVEEARNLKEPKTWEGRIRRARMTRQVSYYTNGAMVPVTTSEMLKLPPSSARAIIDHLDEGDGTVGKIVRSGDGVGSSIVYQLGKPIPVQGQGKEPIREIEFLARTYGDIEDVMAATDPIQQTVLLISGVAKPMGSSLMLLPSWAVGQITMADGVTIMREVLPLFLGSPPES